MFESVTYLKALWLTILCLEFAVVVFTPKCFRMSPPRQRLFFSWRSVCTLFVAVSLSPQTTRRVAVSLGQASPCGRFPRDCHTYTFFCKSHALKAVRPVTGFTQLSGVRGHILTNPPPPSKYGKYISDV